MAAEYSGTGVTARAVASRLLKSPKICARLRELGEQTTSEAVLTIEQRKEKLSQIAIEASTGEKRDYQAAIKAIDALNKMDGAYILRQEVDVRGAMPVVLVDDVGE
jgi:phage terminase small subunit